MSDEYTLTLKDSYAVVNVYGELESLDTIIHILDVTTPKILDNGISRVVWDHTEVRWKNLSYMELHEFIHLYEKRQDQRHIQWAVVIPKERSQNLKDLETLAHNRGFALRGFNTVDDAESWFMQCF